MKAAIILACAIVLPGLSSVQAAKELLDMGKNADYVTVRGGAKPERTSAGQRSGLAVNVARGQSPEIILRCPTGAWDLSRFRFVTADIKNTGSTTLCLEIRAKSAGAKDFGQWGKHASGHMVLLPGEQKAVNASISGIERLPEWNDYVKSYFPEASLAPGRQEFCFWRTLDARAIDGVRISLLDHDRTSTSQFVLLGLRATEPIEVPGKEALASGAYATYIDRYNQFALADWPGKIKNDADLRKAREQEAASLANHPWPMTWSKWGGWKDGPNLQGSGHFRTAKRDGKWWLVDPDGSLFWSLGVCCVEPLGRQVDLSNPAIARIYQDLPPRDGHPFSRFYALKKSKKTGKEALNYDISGALLSAKYGEDYQKRMPELLANRMGTFGLNTYGAWSDIGIATNPEVRRIPYTVILHPWSKPLIDDLYDPFEPGFRDSIGRSVQGLAGAGKPAADPWCLGVFIHNELNWPEGDGIGRFALQAPRTQAAKMEIVAGLKKKHGDIAALNTAWKTAYPSWDALLDARRPPEKSTAALGADLKAFGKHFAETYYRICQEQMRAHAPHKLYLGSRINNVRDDVIAACAKFADVVSFNQYGVSVAGFRLPSGATDKPILIGEFSFPRSGRCMEADGGVMREVFDPDYQPRAYRHYLDGALENPAIVGAHIFRWQEWIIDRADTPHWNLVAELHKLATRMYTDRQSGRQP